MTNVYYVKEIDFKNDIATDQYNNILDKDIVYHCFDILRDLLLKEIQNLEIYKIDYFDLAWDLITQQIQTKIKEIVFNGDYSNSKYRLKKLEEIAQIYKSDFIDLFNEELEKEQAKEEA